MHTALSVENGVNLKPYNTFGLPCQAQTLVRTAFGTATREAVQGLSQVPGP